MKPKESSKRACDNDASIHDDPAPVSKKPRKTRFCVIPDCPSPIDVSYHMFPSNPKQRDLWISITRSKEKYKPKVTRICSRHFREDCFQLSFLMGEMLPNTKTKRRLKPSAIPTLNLLSKGRQSERREKEDLMNELLNSPVSLPKKTTQSKKKKASEKSQVNIGQSNQNITQSAEGSNPKNIIQSSIELKATASSLANDMQIIHESPKHKREKCQNPDCREEYLKYRAHIRRLQRALRAERKKNAKKPNLSKLVNEVLINKGHSKAQVNFLLGKTNRPANFTREEILDCLLLRSISSKAYKFLRDKKFLCLPAPSTLSGWVKSLKFDTGLLSNSLKVLRKSIFENVKKKNFDLTVLSFEETQIVSGEEEGSSSLDKVFGSFKKLQILYAHGLIHQWKQPVFIGFDNSAQREVIFEGIRAIEDSGGKVVQIVSDLNLQYQDMWTKLGVVKDKPYFKHPFDPDRKIFVMADPPHLLKLVRSFALSDGFWLPNRGNLSKDLFTKVLAEQSSSSRNELKSPNKLRPIAVDDQRNDRIFLARQLFNQKIAEFIGQKWPNLVEEREVIRLLGDWYGILSSSHKESPKSLYAAYGSGNTEEQRIVLAKMIHFMEQSSLKSTSQPLPFKDEMILTSRALTLMLPYLRNLYGVDSIPTSRCQKDSLSSLFSRLAKSRDKQGPMDTLNCICLLLLGRQNDFEFFKSKDNESLEEPSTKIETIEVVTEEGKLTETISIHQCI